MTKPKPTPPINTNRYDPYKTYRFAEAPGAGKEADGEKKPTKKAAKKISAKK